MAQQRSDETREKLLIAASDIFAEKGFRDATVAQICRRAGTNISAVNYHFGSKEALYQEAWRQSFAEATNAYPQDGGVSEKAPAAARLRGRMKALMERIADENNRHFYMSLMEFANPTGLLKEVMARELIPLRENTLSVVKELLGPEPTEEQVIFCETCIISMCFHPMLIKKFTRKIGDDKVPVVIDDLEAFLNHLMTFVLAGINAIKRESPEVWGLNQSRLDQK